jgi:hypothetical protein
MPKIPPKRQTARVFTTDKRQVVRPAHEWPAGYVKSFTGVPEDFARPAQGKADKRQKL